MPKTPDPLDAWREALASWAIPDHILAAADESPWLLPPELFARRADAQIERPTGGALARAAEALPPAGTVLDVGAGAGAASLPLTAAARLIAVDERPDMLSELEVRAARRGLVTVAIVGRWPDVATQAPPADVVVSSHVLYNVPDIGPFLVALHEHARRRVVVEITARHPLTELNPLWRRFHDIERPERPNPVSRPIGARPAPPRRRASSRWSGRRGFVSASPPSWSRRWRPHSSSAASTGRMLPRGPAATTTSSPSGGMSSHRRSPAIRRICSEDHNLAPCA
jgi:precorrin-6B methylase 2